MIYRKNEIIATIRIVSPTSSQVRAPITVETENVLKISLKKFIKGIVKHNTMIGIVVPEHWVQYVQ
ncbi:MAG TPA: hypothetical protein VIH57_19335 [Bacteroidales bacterium]